MFNKEGKIKVYKKEIVELRQSRLDLIQGNERLESIISRQVFDKYYLQKIIDIKDNEMGEKIGENLRLKEKIVELTETNLRLCPIMEKDSEEKTT